MEKRPVDNPAIRSWHEFVATRDPAILDRLLAEQATFHSPIVFTPQKGKVVTRRYLLAAMRVLGNQSFRYTRQIVDGREAALEFAVEVDGIEVNGVDLISSDGMGRITDFKVMIRPLKAIDLVHRKMAAMLQGERR